MQNEQNPAHMLLPSFSLLNLINFLSFVFCFVIKLL